MPRRGYKKPLAPIGDPSDPKGLDALVRVYLEAMRVKNYSERTIQSRTELLRYFALWCLERGLCRPEEVTKPILERYQRHLFNYRKHNGAPMSIRHQHHRLTGIRMFFKFLVRRNHLLYNPASELEMPRLEKRLPRHVLSASEADQVLNQANVTEALGIRDRAILETFYSTGMRRAELSGLKLYDLDLERGTVLVRQGKGRRDRMIPIGERAAKWIDKYLIEVRPSLVTPPDEGNVFLSRQGSWIRMSNLSTLVRQYVDAASIGKRGSCHLFRHTMATLMLENGADIRFIQAMLGHASLDTTEVYTQVSIRKLKEIHSLTHPAKVAREGAAPEEPESHEPTREDLEAALEQEARKEEEDIH